MDLGQNFSYLEDKKTYDIYNPHVKYVEICGKQESSTWAQCDTSGVPSENLMLANISSPHKHYIYIDSSLASLNSDSDSS